MKEVIEMLLQKQAVIDEDCEYAKKVECEKIDAAFAERKEKIEALLDLAGYEKPVEVEAEEVTEAQADEEVIPETVATEQVIY